MTDPIYAVGDIHGRFDQLEIALERIHADGGPDAKIVFLGDYADRGPDVCKVLELLYQAQKAGRPWVMLKGNHDRMFEWFAEPFPRQDLYMHVGYHWFHPRVGGVETVASYGVTVTEQSRLGEIHAEVRANVPSHHLEFLRGLKLMHQTEDHLFVHAGIRPGVPFDQQIENDLVWIRSPFLEDVSDHGPLIVHGHTALEYPAHYGNRVNVDTGAGYGRDLYPVVIEGRDVWVLTPQGRQPLPAKVLTAL